MYLLNQLNTFARKKGSKDKIKRKKKVSIDKKLKKSQIFRNYVNPVNNTLREVRGTVKTGLSIGQFWNSLEKTRLQVKRMKRDLGVK